MPSDPADLPIGTASYEILEIERAAALSGEFHIDLGATFADAARAHFARHQQAGPVQLYRLRDVTLDASLMLLLRDRSRIVETRYHVSDSEWTAVRVKPLPAAAHDPADHFVICCNRSWHNYYHWLTQTLPAIDWSLSQSVHRQPTLVLWPLHPWQEETLELLGLQEVPRLTLDMSSVYHFPSAEYSDFVREGMPGMVSRSAMATFGRLSRGVPWLRGTADEIYVARSDTETRAMLNEAEIIALLRQEGVRVVVPGEMSVADQIAVFRAARLVIGPHGAGMTNIVFCEAGSFVYELLPRRHLNPAYNRLAQAAGLNYWADTFDGPQDAPADAPGWQVDPDVVRSRLAAIRARMAASPRVESAMAFLRRNQATHPDDAPPQPQALPPEDLAPERRGSMGRMMAWLFTRGG